MNQTIKDGFKYFTYFMIILACFMVFLVLLVVLLDSVPDEEAQERLTWCEEYHPNLSYQECSTEAGW